ncbi:MAG TPA: helix-turn-helix transcriptional regulator [Pirellulales bacterium]|nr:helix-turn-helix transcriptional regulator [Pirellulales bacterium]
MSTAIVGAAEDDEASAVGPRNTAANDRTSGAQESKPDRSDAKSLEKYRKQVGLRIARVRLNLGFDRQRLAKLSDVKASRINELENGWAEGDREQSQQEFQNDVAALARALGVEPGVLLGDEPLPPSIAKFSVEQINGLQRLYPGELERGVTPQELQNRRGEDLAAQSRAWAAARAKRARHQHELQLAQAQAYAAARAQADAQAAAQAQNQRQAHAALNDALVQALLIRSLLGGGGFGPPSPYPGPYSETILRNGNQTYLYGNGPYGSFSDTISQSGNQTYISGYGLPLYLPPLEPPHHHRHGAGLGSGF